MYTFEKTAKKQLHTNRKCNYNYCCYHKIDEYDSGHALKSDDYYVKLF